MFRFVAGGVFGLFCLLVTIRAQTDSPRQAHAFQKFAPAVKVRWDADFLYVEGNGLPQHGMMTGITAWQQQVPLPQVYRGENAWRIPLRPVPAKEPRLIRNKFLRGAVALAVNGIPIFNPQNNRGEISAEIGELDQWGGHCGRADDYHYHVVPLHLEAVVGKGRALAFALDGYPIYGVREPDGRQPTGLDALNGHDAEGIGYHYHASEKYPYVNGGFHGVVEEREGQVDPQPSARPVRPSLTALRGASITGFEESGQTTFRVDYTVNREKRSVLYQVGADGRVDFEFREGGGGVRRESYTQRDGGKRGAGNPGGTSRGGGGEGRQGGTALGGGPRKGWFEVHGLELDPDGDGSILRAEVEAEVNRVFASFDVNKDGEVSADESKRRPSYRSPFSGFVGEHFTGMDTNGDGILQAAEFVREVLRMFDKQDVNRDGVLTPSEWRDGVSQPERKKQN
jgi:hypothetical protein